VLEGRDRGAGVLLISSDLEEALSLSDRIAIMHAGRIMGVVPAEAADRTRLGLMMTGTPLSMLEGA
jgi:simple sugar transport system ATP-binding protein